MGTHHLPILSLWTHHTPAFVGVAVCLLSVLIVLGCAVASWVAPSEETDPLFHRHVF